MKPMFDKPLCEVVKFTNDVIVTSPGCSCFYDGEDFETDDTCTGGNVACTCNPNYDDPSANCT